MRMSVVSLVAVLAACSPPSPSDVDYTTKGDPAKCAYGPWATHCPTAFWVRDVIREAGWGIAGDTGSAISTGFVYVWATQPPAGTTEPVADPLDRVEDVPIHGDGIRLAWEVHGLRVWAEPEGAFTISPPEVEELVRASLRVAYP